MLFLLGTNLPVAHAQLTEEEPEPEDTWEQRFINGDKWISEWFTGMAEGMDLFLAGKRLTKRKNETSVQIGNSSYTREGEEFQNDWNFNANLRLPNFEEYWQVKFSSYDENQDRGVRETYLRQTPRTRDVGASLGLFKKLANVRVAFQPRASFQNTLKISHSLVFESVADLKRYAFNPKLELFANPDKGAGIFLGLNWNFQLSRKYSFTFVNEGEYQDRPHLFVLTNGGIFSDKISSWSSMSYNLFFSSNNQPPNHLESYNIGISYSHLIYEKILDFSVNPNIDFSRPYDFRGRAGVNFNLNLTF